MGRLREAWQYRELLYVLTWREIRVKYKQSMMGFLWAIFMPLLAISAGMLVKVGFSQVSGEPLSLDQLATVSLKSLPWVFFVSSLRFSTNSLTANVNLVTKISFPKEVFPVSAVCSQLFDFAVASVPVTVVLALTNVGVSVHILWVPVLILMLVALATGLGVFFSAANLFFRDVKYIVEVIVTFAIFFTPVFYEAELMGRFAPLLMINPTAPILEGLNAAVVHHQTPSLPWVLYSAVMTTVIVVGGFAFFHTMQPKFAESI